MAKKMTVATQFINELSAFIDQGIKVSIDEVIEQIEKRNVINWLEKKLEKKLPEEDFTKFNDKEKIYIHERLADCFLGKGALSRKYGTVNNGLCLLINITTEVIRRIYVEYPYKNSEDFC